MIEATVGCLKEYLEVLLELEYVIKILNPSVKAASGN